MKTVFQIVNKDYNISTYSSDKTERAVFFFLNAKYLNKIYVTIADNIRANAWAISVSITGGKKFTFSKYDAKISRTKAFTKYPINHVDKHLKYCLNIFELPLALNTINLWVEKDINDDKNQAKANEICLKNVWKFKNLNTIKELVSHSWIYKRGIL